MKIFTLALCAVALTISSAFAGGTQEGDFEIGISGNFSNNNTTVTETETGDTYESSSDDIYLELEGNYFITDAFSLGLAWEGNTSTYTDDNDDDDTSGQTFFELTARYHFNIDKDNETPVVPYIGLHGGLVTYYDTKENWETGEQESVTSNGNHYGAHAGLKFFLSENTSFNTELKYSKYSVDFDDFGVEYDEDSLKLFFGITYAFGN